MKETACYICGSRKHITLVRQNFHDKYLAVISEEYIKMERSIVVCKRCGFIYRRPQLDENDIEILYRKFRDDSILKVNPDEYFFRIVNLPKDKSENHAKVLWLKKNIGTFLRRSSGNILDIGCGGGVFLYTFFQHFPQWRGFGIEPTANFADLARSKLAVPIVEEMYRPGLFPRRFDFICVLQVLEHILDPVAFLQGVKHDLTSEGKLFIEVPDIADIGHLPVEHDRFHAQHLYIYSLPVLQYICRNAGLTIEHTAVTMTVRNKHNLSVICKHTEKTISPNGNTKNEFPLQDYRQIGQVAQRMWISEM